MRFASGKQVNLASGELKVNNALDHHWCETSLYYLKLFWSMWCPEISLSKLSTSYMWPVLLIISRLLSRSTGMTGFQPCFPGRDLNTGKCSKLHICQQGSNVYILIVNKFVFLRYCLTHSCVSHLDCTGQCITFYLFTS